VGHSRCVVARPRAKGPPASAEVEENGAEIEPCASGTVGAEIMKLVAAQAGQSAAEDLRIQLTVDDRPVARRPLGADRYELELQARGVPGRLPITVRRYSQERLMETRHLSAVVQQRVVGVVAARAIDRRQVLTVEDIRLREVWLTDGRTKPLASVEAAVGQATVRALRQGEIVSTTALAPPVLVKRGEPVTVHCATGTMLLKLAATAMEDGAVGNVIRVRNETSRELFWAEVTGPRQAVVAKGTPPQSAAAEAAPAEAQP
jgi:flagella basal body P-ring formation protein FlgA